MRSRATPGELALLLSMSAVGLASSSLVLYEFYTLHRLPPFCEYHPHTVSIQLNCYAVLTSPYSRLGPFSLDALAAAWFIVNIALALLISLAPLAIARLSLTAIFWWRFIGVAVVPYLVYVEVFIVRAICVYCTVMHCAILADFGVISYLLFSTRSRLRGAILGR
ncbi:MAG: vitamin K epoxide reductase family protein [Acidilobus sp.]